MREVLVLDMTSEEDTSLILDRIGKVLSPPVVDEDPHLEMLVRQAMTIGALATLLERRSPSLATAFAAGRRQGDTLAGLLESRGIGDLLVALLKRDAK